ncbi:MAG: DUF4258 domain-containing protein [Methanospirillaceae archaeon]|nr:DUF4258 domain-containing protein [Methanospirillaceae archaeon]
MIRILYDKDLKIEWRIHALQQIVARNISRGDVLDVLYSGEIIESYPKDVPYPSFLFAGNSYKKELHVVIAYAEAIHTIYIVTAYEPDKDKWDENFRRRI